jgi:hypothetical protein
MAHALEELELIPLGPTLHNLPRALPLLRRKGVVILGAGEQQRLGEILELLVGQGARVRKRARGYEAVRGQRVEHVGRTEAVADAAVFGRVLAVLLGDGFGPLWDRCSGEADVLVSPCRVVEAGIRGLVVFSVFPNRVLHH